MQALAPAERTTRYHSEAMGLDFVYPSGFTNKATADSAPTKEQDKATYDKKAAGSCVTFPITAMDMREAFNMIFLKRSDTACLGIETTAADRGIAAVNFLTNLLRQFGKPTVSSSTDYDIGGHMASTVSGSVKVQGDDAGTVIYGAASCLVAGRNVACFAFLSSDCQTLAVISASTVKFTDTDATPVIPAKLSPACKPGS
jgi:hypothetical protein